MKISLALETLREVFSVAELMEYVTEVSKFHRIQGSSELEKAGELIYTFLKKSSAFEVRIHEFDYSKPYGLHLPVAGWDLEECHAEIVKPFYTKLVSSLESKHCAVAHSPPGLVEGEVVYIGKGMGLEQPALDKLRGKIVLSYGTPYIVYTALASAGVSGFLFYKASILENAVPYLSLFLTPDDATKYSVPAVAIPRNTATRILTLLEKGEKVVVRIDVKACYRATAKIKVIEALLQQSEKEAEGELHVYAHYCHPKNEVNDNVSGVATILETVSAIDRALARNALKISNKKRIAFILFPEYYGSLPYLIKKSESDSKIEFGVNLDMVGEKQELTKSTLNIILPPHFLSNNLYESLLLKILLTVISYNNKSFNSVSKINRYRFDILPYEGGSDHDIYLQFSIPSVMINQWPDIFYHSDEDNIAKFDAEIARDVGIAVGAFSIIASSHEALGYNTETMARLYKELKSGYIAMKQCFETPQSPTSTMLKSTGLEDKERYKYTGPRGVLSLRYVIKNLAKHEFEEFAKLVEDDFINFLALRYIPLLLLHQDLTVGEIIDKVFHEYCRTVERNVILKVLGYLIKLGLVKVIA
jgi:Zn-dependent M28 family amino/carboxypeptidase